MERKKEKEKMENYFFYGSFDTGKYCKLKSITNQR